MASLAKYAKSKVMQYQNKNACNQVSLDVGRAPPKTLRGAGGTGGGGPKASAGVA